MLREVVTVRQDGISKRGLLIANLITRFLNLTTAITNSRKAFSITHFERTFVKGLILNCCLLPHFIFEQYFKVIFELMEYPIPSNESLKY
jgi:hypothetical protein